MGVEVHDEPTAIDHDPLDDEATIEAGPSSSDPIAPGRMLGDYRITRIAGVGGMGIVLAAIHPLIGKRVAIKVLRTDDPAMISRFIDEASVVNQIQHPNIVDVFGFGTTLDGRKYLVMEWLDGESLRARIDRGPMTTREIADVMHPLLRALSAAHDYGVIHRDLKPENIFLTPSGVKLLDFGIAKLVRNDHVSVVQTASGVLVGTPMYAAPEQAAGGVVDHRIDVYTLGAVIFEMMTGRPPFEAESAMLVVAKHMLERPPRMSSLMAVPRDLDDLVDAMLAKEPALRPSLSSIGAVLGRVAAGPVEMIQTLYRPAAATRPLRVPAIGSAVDLPTVPMFALQPVEAEEAAPVHAAAAEPARPRWPILVYIAIACAAVAAGIWFAGWVMGGDDTIAPVRSAPQPPPPPTVTPL